MRKHSAFLILALLFLLAIPAVADDTVYSGSDLWSTPSNGKTFADFSQSPLPAGFFCARSAPFTGRIAFRGIPVSSELGRTDTIIYRLDDALFNDKGVASTRLQVRALSFQSIAPIKTACGSFNVKVSLNGEQPVTRMRIVRDHDNGGRFFAPIAVNVRMTFAPVDGKGREFEVTRNLRFPPAKNAIWSFRTGNSGLHKAGFLTVDTDNDSLTDIHIPGTSNFAAGWRSFGSKAASAAEISHFIESHGHNTVAE